jgi:hydrogenase maturation protein HypF
MKLKRARIDVYGAVQGVGFRPFVYRLASELGLGGWVLNSPRGVCIEIEGDEERVQRFEQRLETEKPRVARITELKVSSLRLAHCERFEIRNSVAEGDKEAFILPDLATCEDCLRELLDPQNRRYRYPFTNCTNCGPRFSIIEALPYDRPNTSMKKFAMCPECEREYHDPKDRRFHAQPNACPKCGPQMELWNPAGGVLAREHDALTLSVDAVRAGKIVAIKGIGGFQLIVDARNENAVRRLRERKHRKEKPFALMFPSFESVEKHCRVSALEKQMLLSYQSPIVLLEKLSGSNLLARSVAPGNPYLGIMLPYSPLHHLLVRGLNDPVVATSGNLSDEPICIDEHEALERLAGIADFFLVHNRPIVRHMDDSIACVMMGREMVLRAGRGYAPTAISIEDSSDAESVLAVGGQLKNTVALKTGGHVFISQHIGDLETEPALAAFETSAADLPRLYEAKPDVIVCDLHPEYLSTKFARAKFEGTHSRRIGGQHHYAHVLSCMAENRLSAPVLGICWDGTGYGLDGTIWGGEFLLVDEDGFDQRATFRQFRLPGGDRAVKQPRRTALGLLYEIFGSELFEREELSSFAAFPPAELKVLQKMLETGAGSPLTSSAGRLFDAIASLLGLRQAVDFEGQAAMDLEFAITAGAEGFYHFGFQGDDPIVIDWEPMILAILEDARAGKAIGDIARKFHHTLAEIIVATARAAGEQSIVLSGGCFQNKFLLERTVQRLRDEGFVPHWHQRVPTNDGGIALGQVMAALRAKESRERFSEGGLHGMNKFEPERKETHVSCDSR